MSTHNQYAQLPNQVGAVGSATQRAARFAVMTAVLTLVLIILLHFIKSDMAPSWHMISEYAIGEYGWVMKLAFFAWSLSCISLVAAVRNQVTTNGGRLGLILLFIVGISIIMAGIFVMDSPQTPKDELTVHGNLHGLAATIGIPGQSIAAMLISLSLARNPSWNAAKRSIMRSAHATWISLFIMIASMMIMLGRTDGQFGPDTSIGWPNRLLVLAYCVWLIVVARQVVKLTGETRQ